MIGIGLTAISYVNIHYAHKITYTKILYLFYNYLGLDLIAIFYHTSEFILRNYCQFLALTWSQNVVPKYYFFWKL